MLMRIAHGVAVASIFSWSIWIYVFFGTRMILRVGRRKRDYRELMKSMSFKDKLFMRDFVKFSNSAKKLQRFFIIWMYFFYISIVAFVVLIIVRIMFPSISFRDLLLCYLFFKGLLFEIPATVVVMLNRRRREWLGCSPESEFFTQL